MDFPEQITNGQNDELYHYGVLGQRKGVRRYQNKDGSLTPEGRVHYGYKDRRTETKLRRGIAASKNDLKKAAERADTLKAEYDKKAREYEKEKNGFKLFRKNTKETDVNNAFYRMNKAKSELAPYQHEVNIALSTLNSYDKKYQDFTKNMIKKYGYTNVRDLKRNTFKASKHYIYDNVINPGLTIADLPGIGSDIGRKYTEDALANKRLARL